MVAGRVGMGGWVYQPRIDNLQIRFLFFGSRFWRWRTPAVPDIGWCGPGMTVAFTSYFGIRIRGSLTSES